MLRLPFRSATLTRLGGDDIVTPLLDPSVVWVGSTAREMADHFEKAARDKIIDRASPAALLPAAGPLTLEARTIEVSVPESTDGHLHPAMTFRFDALLSPLPSKGWIGFVPALGVEAVASNADDCLARLREAVTIEFARKKRRLSTHALIATQWFTGLELSEQTIELPVHTMQDLKDLARQKLRRILPEVGTELKPTQPRAFHLDAEIDALSRALRGRYTRSVLLVGPSGSGKTALVEEFARTAPKKIWEVTAGRLIQKLTRGTGWQENLAIIIRELRETGEILFIRNYAGLFEVGQYSGNSLSIADALRAPVERGEITLISECTPEQAARLDVRAPGTTAMFHVIRIEEPAGATLESIVTRRIPTASPDAVREAIRLQKRYRPYSGFPGKTIRFLDALAQKSPSFAPEGGASEGKGSISRDAVLKRFCEEAGMPEFMVDPAKPLPLDSMERHFTTSVFGQEEATATVVDLLASVKAGLARGGKPIATLLFIGPTGVGKTELAKVLAEFMFGSRSRMIRFDMSEYADAISCLRLTGDAGSEGLLTGAVREEPFGVILFDEVEKAHPVFFDLLLQVLGEGRLTDAGGRVADFCSTIVIMTSNLGASELPKGSAGFAAADGRRRQVLDHFKAAVEAHFRPELFNRLDRVVAFSPLSQEMIRRIVDREVGLLRLRPGLRYRDVALSITPAALDRLGAVGTDAQYGARQLQRAIRDLVALPLAQQLNRYEMETSIEATVDAAPEIEVRVKGVSKRSVDPPGQSISFVSMRVTQQRRRLEDVVEGTVLAKVASDIEILERRKRKTKEKLWIQSHDARQLERYSRLKRDCEAAYADVEFLEAEALLSLVESERTSAADLGALLADHRDRAWKACRALFTLNADTGASILGIYGNVKHLDFFARVYTRIAKHQELDVQLYRVWHSPSKGSIEARPATKEPPAKDAILVGMELRLAGSGASLLFIEEDGLHRLRDREGEWHPYVVLTAGGAWAPFDEKGRPDGVHRRAFFDKKQPRRTILPDSVEDKNYGWSVMTDDYAALLLNEINLRFEDRVFSALR